jgi:hypothetical protein
MTALGPLIFVGVFAVLIVLWGSTSRPSAPCTHVFTAPPGPREPATPHPLVRRWFPPGSARS